MHFAVQDAHDLLYFALADLSNGSRLIPKGKVPVCALPIPDYKSQGAPGTRSSPSSVGHASLQSESRRLTCSLATTPPRPPLPAAGAGAGARARARGKDPRCQDLPRRVSSTPTQCPATPEPDTASLGGLDENSDLRSRGIVWEAHAWIPGKKELGCRLYSADGWGLGHLRS